MNRPRRNRYRISGLLVVVGLLAAVGALAGVALAKDGSRDRVEKRHHHRHHHSQTSSGTIQSFDTETGKLTISLLGGETVSGLVTKRTKIKCEDEHAPDVSQLRHRKGEPGDDNGGKGVEELGDDKGGQGEVEPGDDNGGGGNSGPGSSNSGGGPSGDDDNGTGANCTTSDLIPGAVVQGADLEIEHGDAIFEEVELAG
jgi:hypothetical protein